MVRSKLGPKWVWIEFEFSEILNIYTLENQITHNLYYLISINICLHRRKYIYCVCFYMCVYTYAFSVSER